MKIAVDKIEDKYYSRIIEEKSLPDKSRRFRLATFNQHHMPVAETVVTPAQLPFLDQFDQLFEEQEDKDGRRKISMTQYGPDHKPEYASQRVSQSNGPQGSQGAPGRVSKQRESIVFNDFVVELVKEMEQNVAQQREMERLKREKEE